MKWSGPQNGASSGIVLAHGRGGSADDILGLVAAAGLRDVAAVAPQAAGNSWWPVSFLSPTMVTEPYVARGIDAMQNGVQALAASGIAMDRIWLAGFSQGACLALETFARAGQGLAGVFGFSGGLVGTSDAGTEPVPALYGHCAKAFDYAGTRQSVHAQDPHIPLRRVQDSMDVLRQLGANVQLKVYPGAGHGIGDADLAALRERLSD
jgi:phospholipase/carboxylesterase